MSNATNRHLSLISRLRLELVNEGFTLRDETSTNFEYGSTNANGETKTVYVDNEEMSVCFSENNEAGVLTRADKYPLRSEGNLQVVRTEIFRTI